QLALGALPLDRPLAACMARFVPQLLQPLELCLGRFGLRRHGASVTPALPRRGDSPTPWLGDSGGGAPTYGERRAFWALRICGITSNYHGGFLRRAPLRVAVRVPCRCYSPSRS